jgi:hypothetical protein
MKKQIYGLVMLMMLVTVVGLSPAKAQSGPSELRTNIPFEFNVGNKVMPAGEYILRCVNPSSDLKVMRLFSARGHESVLLQTRSVTRDAAADTKLVFNRYGERYFPAQAWLSADNSGMQLPKSRWEKQMAGELAANKRATVEVALKAKK